jgi:hypothetical protein
MRSSSAINTLTAFLVLAERESPMGKSIAVALAGLAIGWIAGLSVSPVVSSIMAALLAIGVAVVAALAGLPGNSPQPRTDEENANARTSNSNVAVNPIPVAVFTVCLALGASFGVYVRSNHWLAPVPTLAVVNQWSSLGLKKEDVAEALFENWIETSAKEGNLASAPAHRIRIPQINHEDDGDIPSIVPGVAPADIPSAVPVAPPTGSTSKDGWGAFCRQLPSYSASGQISRLNNLIKEHNISVLATVAPKLSEQELVAASKSFCSDFSRLTAPTAVPIDGH